MSGTYEIIKSLPAKGTDWRGLVDALSSNYVAIYTVRHGGPPYAPTSTDGWATARTVRELRIAAMEAASWAVEAESKRARRIEPSPETLAWGGFLGGETVVWLDLDAAEAATNQVREIVRRFA